MSRRIIIAEIAKELASRPLVGNDKKCGPDLEPILGYFPRKDKNIGFDWCAAFVYHCCCEAGLKLPIRYPEPVTCNFAWVKAWLDWSQLTGFYFQASDLTYTPEHGDLIIFDNILGDGPQDHIGVVLGMDKDKVITAEGNFHNRSGIFHRDRLKNVNGFIRIDDTYQYMA
ncbi:CHAP domain-containing protein [Paenibacillus sp. URB8-2]|uniref:CHAP domain-containing protein n=1 Tax=Paenibacillus sp. URB8-2 TaxID=2741301 RepID=UPI0015BA6171|nr:CHAP domain-containing protein [Paenibacillus sp. URB8-2]BCG60807.1 hypothetical protein PUR_42320 [Paenibacillus sp. URB8-2]